MRLTVLTPHGFCAGVTNALRKAQTLLANTSPAEVAARRSAATNSNTSPTGVAARRSAATSSNPQTLKPSNTVSSGAAPRRKKIVLCPHHTIDRETDGLALSTFLRTGELLLKLPALFPEVDFVFRPHPLLFVRLATPKWWGEERTAEYVRKMESYPNVEFQRGGDYFETFASSDALIHDCGSFLAEYFYTGMPQCYLLESEKTVEEQFLPFSKRLLAHAHRAFTDEDVISFIRDVVIAGDDPDRATRAAFAAREVCVNYPDATGRVIAATLEGIEKGSL